MWRRLWGLLVFIAAALWLSLSHYVLEFVRAALYERVLHMLNPYIEAVDLDPVIQYGVPVALVALGLWLFFHTGRASEKQVPLASSAGGIVSAERARGGRLTTIGIMLAYFGSACCVLAIVFIVLGYIQDEAKRAAAHAITLDKLDRSWTQEKLQPVEPVIKQLPTEIPTPPPAPPPPPPREFVAADITPKVLAGFFDNNTLLRAQTLASQQTGKWMRLSGSLGQVNPGIGTGGNRTPTMVTFSNLDKPWIYMWFDSAWNDRLALLPKDQTITVVGTLKKVERTSVEFENCELVTN